MTNFWFEHVSLWPWFDNFLCLLHSLGFSIFRYEIKFSEDQQYFTNHTLWDELNSTNLIKQEDVLHGSLLPAPGGNPVVILLKPEKFDKEKVYFIAMKAYDDSIPNKDSGVSNFGQIYRFDKPEENTGYSGGDIFGIFIGCVYLIGAFLIVVGYLVYQKFA